MNFNVKHILKISTKSISIQKKYKNLITQKNPLDSGFNLIIPNDTFFKPKETKLIDLNIKCFAYKKINNEYINLPFYIYTRSSIYKTPLRLSNNVGIIDLGYQGNIKIALDNIKNEDYLLKEHKSIVQVCFINLQNFDIEIHNYNDKLKKTQRGSGCFGSTD